MIDFYYWPTPNGWKVSILLEELGVPYTVKKVNIGAGEQFSPEFLAICPNHRIPAIVDHDVDGESVPIFESGAIMWYLANKFERFIPQDPRGQKEILEWLFWQVGNLGPMAGQHSHFQNYSPRDKGSNHERFTQVYSRERYRKEYHRCIGVLERQLEGRDFLVGNEYSIADMISWPWILIAKAMGQPLDEFPNVTRWRQVIKERPAVERAVNLGKDYRREGATSEQARKYLFGQTADTAKAILAERK